MQLNETYGYKVIEKWLASKGNSPFAFQKESWQHINLTPSSFYFIENSATPLHPSTNSGERGIGLFDFRKGYRGEVKYLRRALPGSLLNIYPVPWQNSNVATSFLCFIAGIDDAAAVLCRQFVPEKNSFKKILRNCFAGFYFHRV